MKLYHYDPDNKEYLGSGEAQLDPLENALQKKEAYIVPANATIDVPPQAGEREAVVYRDGSWHTVPDHRGEIWWRQDGTQYRIEALDIAPAATDVEHDPRPSVFHVWPGDAWVLDRERWLNTVIRPKRDQLLNEVDMIWCNADKWESMTQEKKQAWREYKQALRDLPGIIDYRAPVWPTAPI